MNQSELTELANDLKARATALGFDHVGVAPAETPEDYPHFRDWLDQGFQADMAYMERQAEPRRHPESILEGVRSVVMVAAVYGQPEAEGPPKPDSGKVARYAQGDDYHTVFWRRLEQLGGWLSERAPNARWRAICDTAPLLERDFARRAGLGWIGKNTMLIDRRLGSYTLLGALLTDLELPDDARFETDHCGTCTRCLEACPTQAFDGPYRLDARRCLSYWTIEHRGPIPTEIAEQLEGWVFGCDICQEVCPWNRKAPAASVPAFSPDPERLEPDLIAWLQLDADAFRQRFRHTALTRAKRSGLLRNAALALGNRRERAALPVLRQRLEDPEEDPVIRGAAAWALGRISGPEARAALRAARDRPEFNPDVHVMIQEALKQCGHAATPGSD